MPKKIFYHFKKFKNVIEREMVRFSSDMTKTIIHIIIQIKADIGTSFFPLTSISSSMTSNDVDQIDTLLADPHFDAISFVNELLPDESSLTTLDEVIHKLKIRANHINGSIREAVRNYSVLGNTSEIILTQTQNTIADLTKRIADIHDQATDTEAIVSKFCDEIKPLDNAKCGLEVSMKALRSLSMIEQTIKELQEAIDRSDYQNCAHSISANSALFEIFKDHMKLDQVKPFYNQVFDLKRMLRNKINTELETRLFRGSLDESNIPICNAIDAFKDDFTSNTIELFCDKFIAPYTEAFQNSPLKDIKKRIQWFKQRMDFFNKQYQNGFPKEWRMQYHITVSFCAKTANHLMGILRVQPDVKEYLAAFDYIVKFENKMADLFAGDDVVYIDKDAPVPEFPNTSEGIREKYKFIHDRDNHIGRKVKVPAKEFIGMIAGAFNEHVDLYLQAERDNLESIIKSAVKNLNDELDPQNHTLNSSASLIVSMRQTIDKCASFNLSQKLLDLFLIIKDLIIKYAATLTTNLPSRPKKTEQFQIICSIANTSAQMLTVISSLSSKVINLVPDEIKPAINVEDARDSIGSELKKQLVYLSDVIIKECESLFIQIGNNQWRGEDDDETYKVPPDLQKILYDRFELLGEWLSSDNFNRVRPTFISHAVLVIHESLFKSKNAPAQSTRILLTIKEVKQLLTDVTKADSRIGRKRIDNEFSQLETELTILCCPNVAMTGTYLTKAKTPSKDHYISILKLRGCSSDEINRCCEEYDKMYRELHVEEQI